ncbi:ExeM/NucH family extracellular endonuclease [Chitinimonas sp. BJB300]|uniref:ExeM/NucH family extracellular endonuclease n=1 Tax=Chitinimonas sp. BJB300 TaxID=1559339 RepID=UPI000C0EB163|nr:ExeM/NucH family extracellular endonuclease [Chitinimonas sp. BJB300]PHV11690.1 endonuclease/exonuclease/phosphatase [Chitinimonas sp. BJB300]TSJ88589.1 ExeM/NucH family extracellular endonuclease [Chitinimonas sp. BJB300]
MQNVKYGLLSAALLAGLAGCNDAGGDPSPTSTPQQPQAMSMSMNVLSCVTPPNTLRDITAVQGPGSASPYVDQLVSVRGVVTADFQADDQLKGFYIQQAVADNDPRTSEGLFIYAPGGLDIQVGDYVQVSGKVTEFKGSNTATASLTEMTEVSTISVCGRGPTIPPHLVKLPVATPNELEPFEGMLVEFHQDLTVTDVHQLGRYGELMLSPGGRLYEPYNHPYNASIDEIVTRNKLASIILDDGRSMQNPKPIPYLSAADTTGTRRVGDVVTSLQGVMSWGSDAYRIHPVVAPVFSQINPRPATPPTVGGTLRASGLNVLNYFTTLGQRGANTAEEFTRQRAKLVETITGLNADVLGLMEIENNGAAALIDLVNAVNAKMGAGTYSYIDAGKPGTDLITVAMIYKPSKVKPIGTPAVLNDSDFSVAGGMRPSVAQRFAALDNNGSFWMVVNHLKSKGSCPSGANNPDRETGQGCWNVSRTRQATVLKNWINGLVADSGESDVLMVGDFNSYLNEDPIRMLETAGFEALLKRLTATERYTYVFSGESGALDHGFASASMRSQVNGLGVWHVNAEEPPVFDYNTEFKPDDRYAASPYRSSDHDPVLVGLNLTPDVVVHAPSLSANLPSNGIVGGTVSITGIVAADGTALSVDWGDGVQATLPLATKEAVHTFATAGNYTLRLRLTNAHGQSAERVSSINITHGTPPAVVPELFFSEYLEGSSNNKALEIYNPTDGMVDLTAYTVRLYANGASTASSAQALSGSLAPGHTLVLVHLGYRLGSIPGSQTSNVTNFNGNDAVVLEKSGIAIDAIGQKGFDPGTEWKTGNHCTANKTLRRKAGVVKGSLPAAAPGNWDVSAEWDVFNIDTYDGLGRR